MCIATRQFVGSLLNKELRMLSSTAIAAVLVFSATSFNPTDAGAAEKTVTLRGTTIGNTIVGKVSGYFTQVQGTMRSHLNGAEIVESEIVEEHSTQPVLRQTRSWFDVSDVVEGLRDAAIHTKENAVDSVLFRPTHDAVRSRNASIEMPNYGPLRQSMLHSTRYDSGLREGGSTVADSISAALRGSYSSRAQLERANAEQARMHAAIAGFLPQVNLTLEASKAQLDSTTSGPFRQTAAEGGIEVTVPLFTSGVNINTYRQAKHTSIAAKYTYLAEEQVAALEAVAAHINLRLNRKIERALKQNVAALNKIQSIAERLFEAGDASRTDIEIAKANVEGARSEVDFARRTREETLADFESVTGRSAPRNLQLSKAESLVPVSLDAAIETAIARNPNILAAEHNAIAGRHNAKAVRGRFGPQVSGFATYDHSFYDSIDDDPTDTWSVGVRLRMPLVDFSAVPSIDAARHEAAESEYQALEQERELRRRLARQWSAYHSAVRRMGIVQRQVRAVAASLEGSRREYEAGFRSITDVLNDQVRLTRAKISLENTRHEKLLAAYEIAFSTSDESVQHLALAN